MATFRDPRLRRQTEDYVRDNLQRFLADEMTQEQAAEEIAEKFDIKAPEPYSSQNLRGALFALGLKWRKRGNRANSLSARVGRLQQQLEILAQQVRILSEIQMSADQMIPGFLALFDKDASDADDKADSSDTDLF